MPPRWIPVLATLLLAPVTCGCRGQGGNEVTTLHDVESGRQMRTKQKSQVDIKELSGLGAWRDQQSGQMHVAVVGDNQAKIGLSPYRGVDTDLTFTVIPTKPLYEAADQNAPSPSQWEGIATDGRSHFIILQEHPAVLHIFDFALSRLIRVLPLKVKPSHPLYERWNRDDNAKGEGLVLLRRGHILLLKEKDPELLVEFGPEGDAPLGFSPGSWLGLDGTFEVSLAQNATLVPLKVWAAGNSVVNRSADLSDLAVDERGRLYALGDQDRMIYSLSGTSDEEEASWTLSPDGEAFRANTAWRLPDDLAKPEGLAFTDGDRPVVALDSCDPGAKCVFTLNRLSED